ncbi:hypothetical protein O3G_MSEX010523 [Manduca sexta]|uniref:RRM domain-containing protein n=1 Tax=Manduca sexta TaxID=7130 RepID=A0A922CTJ0_MANSE|nr:hypothetical protein O3G_MSEX010523 [Manduca sexta]KAG6457836.1 hypothetical protein O3G_MSEX010523 [Manduca sexta]KAG6457837.1 hypothetical protein O3G_MSEX010523 [Manduca sexta]
MDYVVGSVAALISGNVTPNRPRLIRRALTPTKHQQSPNVTPKSEAVDDRSIFLSPTLQKKKAIVKKSPKRIFQNPDLDVTNGDSSLVSPKADKVKKHLNDELEADDMAKKSPVTNKSPKNKRDRKSESEAPEVKVKDVTLNLQVENESTPKKKKKKRESESTTVINETQNNESSENHQVPVNNTTKSPKKMKLRRKSILEDPPTMEIDNPTNIEPIVSNESDTKTKSPKKKKKNKQIAAEAQETTDNKEEQVTPSKKKNRKRKKKSKVQNQPEVTQDQETDKENENGVNNEGKKKKRRKKKSKAQNTAPIDNEETQENTEQIVKNKKSKKPVVNPNAITNQDSDSEHESDDEIEWENEEINKKVLDTGPAESSSDEEDEEKVKPKEAETKVQKSKEEKPNENDAEVLRRTLFVGNVPFSNKCKKEIKKIFNKYGQIETIRIRTVPVKDARTTPKLAVIKKELHPERSTVNVYIKYADPDSVNKALAENNTVLNEHHLRVSRSDSTGAEHDPKCSVFVGNLPFALEDEALRTKFEKCGEIDSVRIIRDKKTNAGKGFGYVNFKSKDGVELALALTEEDLTIKNRILRVKRCTLTAQKGKHQPHQKREFKKFGRDQRDMPGQGPKEDGAFRRILNKRKNQDGGGDGPPNKRQNLSQPSREKKPRKEFVGMTAEKKKKRKFNKGQKKKKALSEILTK